MSEELRLQVGERVSKAGSPVVMPWTVTLMSLPLIFALTLRRFYFNIFYREHFTSHPALSILYLDSYSATRDVHSPTAVIVQNDVGFYLICPAPPPNDCGCDCGCDTFERVSAFSDDVTGCGWLRLVYDVNSRMRGGTKSSQGTPFCTSQVCVAICGRPGCRGGCL